MKTSLERPGIATSKRLRFDAGQLSIEGVKLESRLSEVVERLGKPKVSELDGREYEWRIFTPHGENRSLVIRTNENDELVAVWGEVLELDGKPILHRGQVESDWTRLFGEVETKEIPVPQCGYSTPRSDHPYFYPSYKLNICGATEGFFWRGPVRASSFALSSEPQEFYLGYLGFRVPFEPKIRPQRVRASSPQS